MQSLRRVIHSSDPLTTFLRLQHFGPQKYPRQPIHRPGVLADDGPGVQPSSTAVSPTVYCCIAMLRNQLLLPGLELVQTTVHVVEEDHDVVEARPPGSCSRVREGPPAPSATAPCPLPCTCADSGAAAPGCTCGRQPCRAAADGRAADSAARARRGLAPGVPGTAWSGFGKGPDIRQNCRGGAHRTPRLRRPAQQPFDPRQSRPSARTLAGRLGKAVQPNAASDAVNAIPDPRAEPQRSASFTDFQFHVQILHFVFSGTLTLPASLRFFSGRRGSLRSMRTPSRWPGTLGGSSARRRRLLSIRSFSVKPGKRPAALLPLHSHTQPECSRLGSFPMWDGRSVASYSLKQ